MKMFLRRLLSICLVGMIISQGSAIAATLPQLRHPFYDPGGDCSSSLPTGSSAQGSWNSGLTPPYILQRFMIEVLKDVAQKTGSSTADTVTKEHVLALVAFAFGEGGDINNDDLFNPMNSGISAPDLVAGTHAGNGVQSFKSFDAGVEATARALTDSNHTRLIPVLTKPSSTAEQFMYTITYFQKYPGNAIWAEGSDPAYHNQGQAGQDAYYQRHLQLVQQLRSNYERVAALVIGTPALEQLDNLTDVSKLDKSLEPDGTSQINATNDLSGSGCPQNTSTSSSSGGYINPFTDPAWGLSRTDQGVDYNPGKPLPVLAIGDGTILSTNGSGWPGGIFILYKLSGGQFAGKCIYVAEHLNNVLAVGSVFKAGDTIATALPGSPWSEWGWAQGPQTPSDPYNGRADGTATEGGKSFARFIRSLGGPSREDPGPGTLYSGKSCP